MNLVTQDLDRYLMLYFHLYLKTVISYCNCLFNNKKVVKHSHLIAALYFLQVTNNRNILTPDLYTQDDDSWSSIPAISCENLQETHCYRPENSRNPMQGSDDRIWLPVLTGSCKFRGEPDKSGRLICSPKYCFHEIPGKNSDPAVSLADCSTWVVNKHVLQ
jgi:hypothetical protein